MAKNAVFDNALLKILFQATPTITGLLDNTATSPNTVLWFALHTADPTVTAGAGTINTQNASEIAYTSYARVSVARTTGGFTVTGGSVSPVAAISFPAGTGGSGTASFFSVGTASSGASQMMYSGAISPTIVCGSGVTPQLTTGSAITES